MRAYMRSKIRILIDLEVKAHQRQWPLKFKKKKKTIKLTDKTNLNISIFYWGRQTNHSSETTKNRKSGEKKLSLFDVNSF